jgi:uncharacterized integral membrane protein
MNKTSQNGTPKTKYKWGRKKKVTNSMQSVVVVSILVIIILFVFACIHMTSNTGDVLMLLELLVELKSRYLN